MNEKKITEQKMELTDEDLDCIAGGRMEPSLYTYASMKIQNSGVAYALKEKAMSELNRMRASGTAYSPVDVEAMLSKRGIR